MNSIYWFRKCKRLHDNKSLYDASVEGNVYPLYIECEKPELISDNRIQFINESLTELNSNLKKLGSNLIYIKGDPICVLEEKIKEWNIKSIYSEYDTEPHGIEMDKQVHKICNKYNVKLILNYSHTIFNLNTLYRKNNGTVLSYKSFLNIIKEEKIDIASTPNKIDTPYFENSFSIENIKCTKKFVGGEIVALNILHSLDGEWIRSFLKPRTIHLSDTPLSTSILSPYINTGCISVKYILKYLRGIKVNLSMRYQETFEGQFIWRDFYYFIGTYTKNFNRNRNSISRNIKWDKNKSYLRAWTDGKTGYPFIDAIMIQLRLEGWIHHLARHAVACFLTRGDLYLNWEHGRDVFEELLLDSDYFANNGNWLWVSASSLFNQYWKVYNPITFGKKMDPEGIYIRKYVPILKNFPDKYIYSPWRAPNNLQIECKCIIGIDYPQPIVDHKETRRINIEKLKEYYRV